MLRTAGIAGAAIAGTALARIVLTRRRALAAVPAELRHPLLLLPVHLRSAAVVRLLTSLPVRPSALVDGVEAGHRVVAGHAGAPPVAVHVYEPHGRERPSGALLWIHGGGYVIGDPATYHDVCSSIAAELGVLVVSVGYRLAPADPFPAGLDDCYSALAWLHGHAGELGVDPARIAVAGDSAGGGLAACLAQLAHDRGEVPVAFQALVYPMLDDRTVLRADHAGTGMFVWSPASNRFGWSAYLGHEPTVEAPASYAVAARRDDLTGLPPAWIGVGDLDLFHAEDIAYARRLRESGVPCDLHVVPGMYHGADALFRRAPVMTGFRASMISALRSALAG
ncbi:hypothetical protein MB27_41120 [Actinoplanes utahensis]|uniref:Alpha/beta hydrolase fold-3 domain-containing protein n=1 Tax=Actinoplanes utahensis TaxID=1869 RepID=A0A0A6U8E4_ACTUT|nr:hypothetical protein MB27_41120 [Actinoplanes utahensis]